MIADRTIPGERATGSATSGWRPRDVIWTKRSGKTGKTTVKNTSEPWLHNIGGCMAILFRSVAFVIVLAFVSCGPIYKMTGVSGAGELDKIGVPAEAKVLEIWETGARLNKNPVVGLLIEVYPKDRVPYQAKTKGVISILSIPRIQPGSMVNVRYDPANPDLVALDLFLR
jgi:hypothetical protein